MERILVILPFYGGSLPIGRYCAAALKDLGYLVETFESPDFFSAFSALKKLHISNDRLEYLENCFLQVISQAILSKVGSFQPDFVLCLAQAPMHRQTLSRLRQEKIPTAIWFVEDHALFPYWQAFAPHYDIFAVIQKEPLLSKLQEAGSAHRLYLPMAALPSLHKPLVLSDAEKQEFGSTFSFLGAGYPNRREAFARFIGKDFKLWGTEWEESPQLMAIVQRSGERISPEDAVKIYNATTININLHSGIRTDMLVSDGDFVNPRTFELAACGAFQLVDKRTLLPELFTQDEITTFTSIEDLEAAIEKFSRNPEQCKAIAEKARQRVLRDHTYQHRMKTLLDYAKKHFPHMGQKKHIQWPKEMPEQTRKEIQELLVRLGLPELADFSDVVAALKQKSGQLSDLETALLFLDEWKKLYTKTQ